MPPPPPPSAAAAVDDDDDDEDDMQTLRNVSAAVSASISDSDTASSDDDDDIALLRRIQDCCFPSPSTAASDSLPPPFFSDDSSDVEDDLQTLRAIQRKFSQYRCDSPAAELSPSDVDGGGAACTAPPPIAFSHFPASALSLLDTIKKNRACQKFLRTKLIELDAKIEENSRIKSQAECIVDYQLECEQRARRAPCLMPDPCAKLISARKPHKPSKNGSKKPRASRHGPEENSRVASYRAVMQTFPVSLCSRPWSNTEKEKLLSGIKQQYQEMMVLESMRMECDNNDASIDPVLLTGSIEVSSEQLRAFVPLVDWDRLACLYLPSRRGDECESMWLNCEDPAINHGEWTSMEDKKLLHIVQERGLYNWIEIAVMLGTNRTPYQCLARYQRSLNPHILNKDWTKDEDAKLHEAVEIYGDTDWQMVASNLDGRTGVQCSYRWRVNLNPERKKVGRWSVDEDKRLKAAVMIFGAKNWHKIARFAPGRTQVQCRERWLNCLDPSLNLDAWTEEEDAQLLAAIEEHGHAWSKVATCVPPRTDNQCRRRWKVLLPDEVPVLQAARRTKRVALINNFVGRESERPLIGPNDFVPTVNSPIVDNKNGKRIGRRSSKSNQPRRTTSKSQNSLSESCTAYNIVNIYAENASSELTVVAGANPSLNEGETVKRKRKGTSTEGSTVSKRRQRKKSSDGSSATNQSGISSADKPICPKKPRGKAKKPASTSVGMLDNIEPSESNEILQNQHSLEDGMHNTGDLSQMSTSNGTHAVSFSAMLRDDTHFNSMLHVEGETEQEHDAHNVVSHVAEGTTLENKAQLELEELQRTLGNMPNLSELESWNNWFDEHYQEMVQ